MNGNVSDNYSIVLGCVREIVVLFGGGGFGSLLFCSAVFRCLFLFSLPSSTPTNPRFHEKACLCHTVRICF